MYTRCDARRLHDHRRWRLLCVVGGLLNIKSTHLDQKNNIAGSKYQFTKDMVKTDLGRKFVKDDVHEEQIEY